MKEPRKESASLRTVSCLTELRYCPPRPYGPPRPLGDRRCPLPAMGAEAVGSETAGIEAAAGGRDGYLSSFRTTISLHSTSSKSTGTSKESAMDLGTERSASSGISRKTPGTDG